MLYNVSVWLILYLLFCICYSRTPILLFSSSLSPLVTTSLFSVSMSLLLFLLYSLVCCIFLDSTCRRPGFDLWITKIPGERNGNPVWYSCLENPMDKGSWWATFHRVAKSQAWLSNSHTHTHKWYQTVFVFFCVTDFTFWHNALKVHPCCTWQIFILLFNGWIVLYYIYGN